MEMHNNFREFLKTWLIWLGFGRNHQPHILILILFALLRNMYIFSCHVYVLEISSLEVISSNFLFTFLLLLIAHKTYIELHIYSLSCFFVVLLFDDETMSQPSEEYMKCQCTKITILLPHTDDHKPLAKKNCGIWYEIILSKGSPLNIAFR